MENQMLSLYDYLGHAAGGDLGKKVAEAAKISKIKCKTKQVSNPKYTGEIMLYPKSFLDEYFGKTNKTDIFIKTDEDDILPF